MTIRQLAFKYESRRADFWFRRTTESHFTLANYGSYHGFFGDNDCIKFILEI